MAINQTLLFENSTSLLLFIFLYIHIIANIVCYVLIFLKLTPQHQKSNPKESKTKTGYNITQPMYIQIYT